MNTIKLTDLLSTQDFTKINGNIGIIQTEILDTLLSIELPAAKEIVIQNICLFLNYLNTQIDINNNTLLVITQSIFEEYFGTRQYNEYKKILKYLNILTQVEYLDGTGYSKEKGIAKQYRVHTNYLTNNDFTLIFFKANKRKKIELDIQKIELDNYYIQTIINEELNYKKVFENEIEHHKKNNTTNFSLFVRLTRALSLQSKRYIKKGNKVDRIYHSFSNLSRVTRKCFITKFNNIDLKNSQPILLCVYLNKENKSFEKEYQTICEDGKFYELFYDLYNNDRDKVKVAVYESLFFAFNENRRVNKRFKELFPQVWQILKEIDTNKNISLASILQNIEADLFNNIKVRSIKYFTLFDAIYFKDKKDIEYISKQIYKFGNSNNVKLTISINE